MIATTFHRPEDRRRSSGDSAAWVDTLPACFRSEAFAEDLDGPAETVSTSVAVAAQPRAPAWRLWYGLAAR